MTGTVTVVISVGLEIGYQWTVGYQLDSYWGSSVISIGLVLGQ